MMDILRNQYILFVRDFRALVLGGMLVLALSTLQVMEE